MSLGRIHQCFIILLGVDRIKTAEIAEKLEVSRRTVYRYIDELSEAGVPVVSYPGRNGGFSLQEQYRINAEFFSLEEYEALIDCLNNKDVAQNKREMLSIKLTALCKRKERSKKFG